MGPTLKLCFVVFTSVINTLNYASFSWMNTQQDYCYSQTYRLIPIPVFHAVQIMQSFIDVYHIKIILVFSQKTFVGFVCHLYIQCKLTARRIIKILESGPTIVLSTSCWLNYQYNQITHLWAAFLKFDLDSKIILNTIILCHTNLIK